MRSWRLLSAVAPQVVATEHIEILEDITAPRRDSGGWLDSWLETRQGCWPARGGSESGEQTHRLTAPTSRKAVLMASMAAGCRCDALVDVIYCCWEVHPVHRALHPFTALPTLSQTSAPGST